MPAHAELQKLREQLYETSGPSLSACWRLDEMARAGDDAAFEVLLEAVTGLSEERAAKVLRYARVEVRARLLRRLDEPRADALMRTMGGTEGAAHLLQRGELLPAIAALLDVAERTEVATQELELALKQLTTLLQARAAEWSEAPLRRAVRLQQLVFYHYHNVSGDDPYGDCERELGPDCQEVNSLARIELARRGLKP